MFFKNSLKYLFIGISIFSYNALKADLDSSLLSQDNLVNAFEAKCSHKSDKHSEKCSHKSDKHHPKLRKIVDLFFLADFRFSASQFAASSSQRTFNIWGGVGSASQTISNDVISGFTIANAVSSAVATNAVLNCSNLEPLVEAWTAFAVADIAQTNDPSPQQTLALVAAAVNVGRLFDDCVEIRDHDCIRNIRNRLTSITANFSPNLKSGELFQKIQEFSEENSDIPVFEILFGLYGLARSGTNFTASVAHGVADTDAAAAAIIYIDSQILSEASFLIMDIITLTVTLIDFIEHKHHHHHHHHHHHDSR